MSDKLTEFEEKVLDILYGYEKTPELNFISFIEKLRKIMPPTCGKEQRKFLNEIEKSDIDNEIMWDTFVMSDGKGNSTKVIGANFANVDIPNVDLYKVIKGE